MKKQNTIFSKPIRKSVFLFVAAGLGVAVTAVACGGGHGHHMSPKMMQRLLLGHVDDVMDDIDATDAQRATFDAAAKSILAEAQALKKSHHRHKKEMLTLLSNPTPDREEIKLHIQEKIDGLEEFALRNVDKILDAYETLDAAQRQIILDKLAKHMEKH